MKLSNSKCKHLRKDSMQYSQSQVWHHLHMQEVKSQNWRLSCAESAATVQNGEAKKI